jgi:hypothetical protein
MVRHLAGTFTRLFVDRRSRLAVALLILVIATVPAAEMLAAHLFSGLIIEGPRVYRDDPSAVLLPALGFFGAFVLTRGAHHLVKVRRVQVFRRGFETSGRQRTRSQESWEWALAFELSSVLASLVQVVTFLVLFLVLDLVTGFVNAAMTGAVLWLVSVIFVRQLRLQQDYVRMGNRPGTIAIAQRVDSRIRHAESGAAVATAGMVVALAAVLVRALNGDITSADAIVMFLGLRLLYGQLGVLSAGIMRFARASAREGGRRDDVRQVAV